MSDSKNIDSEEIIAARSADVILGPNPIVGFRAKDLMRDGWRALGLVMRKPRMTVGVAIDFGKELRKISRGESTLQPIPKDKRWKDPAWQDKKAYHQWLQSYLALTQAMSVWVAQQDVNVHDRARLTFLSQLFGDAIAPSNFPWQPEAIRKFKESNGQSARNGIRNLIRDIRENKGMPAQVDKSSFKVGGNLACTEGAVILRTELIELIQYKPLTPNVKTIPILIVPPQINKFYIFDLSPEKSLVRGLLEKGFQVFVVSWRNPNGDFRDWGLAEYAAAIDIAVSTVCALTKQIKLNLVGACAGGTTLASYVAARAVSGDRRVDSLTLLVNVLDMNAIGDSPLGLFASPTAIETAKRYSQVTGVLDGRDMANTFAWMRPNDLVWSYWVNNVLLGKKPPAFDVLYWNNDSTRLPARLHAEFLDIYRTNALTKSGTLRLHGVPVDLGNVRCDTYLVSGTTDHITPWKACYRSTQLFKGKNTFILSNSGHIQSILNPIGNAKAEFWSDGKIGNDPDVWLKSAKHYTGSWWSHWHDWLERRSGDVRVSPNSLGSEDYPIQDTAPGRYVHE